MKNVFRSIAPCISSLLLSTATPGYGQIREVKFDDFSLPADRLSLVPTGNLVWKNYRPLSWTSLRSMGLDGFSSIAYVLTTAVEPFYVPVNIPGGIDQSGGIPYFVDSSGMEKTFCHAN